MEGGVPDKFDLDVRGGVILAIWREGGQRDRSEEGSCGECRWGSIESFMQGSVLTCDLLVYTTKTGVHYTEERVDDTQEVNRGLNAGSAERLCLTTPRRSQISPE